jgi:hypothetical protein
VQYMLLIYDDEQQIAQMNDAERGPFMREYFEYTASLRERGAYVHGEPLQPTSTATTVQVRDGETLTTDGPFAETKEQLGGFYLIDVESLDEAIEWASKVPSARLGKIEVRPVLAMGTGTHREPAGRGAQAG